MGHRLGFADLELQRSLEHNRSLRLMENLNAAIDWSRIESVLMSHYPVGTSREGADDYPPFKFSRNFESNWTIKNDKPHYELK